MEIKPPKFVQRIVDRFTLDVQDGDIGTFERTYNCHTADCEKLGGVVVALSNRDHVHPCPIEEDMCSSPKCNETGTCQA